MVEYCQQLLEQGYTQEQVDEYVQTSCQPDAPWQTAEATENGYAHAQVSCGPVHLPAWDTSLCIPETGLLTDCWKRLAM